MGLEDPLPIGNRKFSDSTSAFRKYSTPNREAWRLQVTQMFQVRFATNLSSKSHFFLLKSTLFVARTGTQAPLQKARSRLDSLASKKKEKTEICIPKPVFSLQNFLHPNVKWWFWYAEALQEVCPNHRFSLRKKPCWGELGSASKLWSPNVNCPVSILGEISRQCSKNIPKKDSNILAEGLPSGKST